MKLLTTSVAAFLMATTVSAADLDFGGEVTAKRNIDTDVNTIVLTPEVTYTGVEQLELTLSSDLSVYNNTFTLDETVEVLPTLKFLAEYDVTDSVELFASTSYDLEAEDRGDLTVGATFSF
jgi:hypothetical protein